MPDISIIIVNYKGWERLTECLDSLKIIEDSRFSFEVIVVENCSNDGRLASFTQLYPKFTFIENAGNLGFASGCNLGVSKSKGPFLLFLNPDTIVNAEAIFLMREEVRMRKDFSVISCQQVKTDGSKEQPYGRFLTISTLSGWLRALNQLVNNSKKVQFQQTENYIYPDWVSGSVIMVSRKSFNGLGGWDVDFWMYYEDVDLCRRAHQKNGDVVLLKNAIIVHNHGGSSRINLHTTALTKTEVNISRHVYISKHETGWKAVLMHTFLVLNNLLFGFIPALAGSILFFIRDLNIISRIYFRLAGYYLNCLKQRTWLSIRSVNYNLKRG